MTNAELAAAFVLVVVPAAIAARWLVLNRRGRLEWSGQLPLLSAGAFIMVSAVLITFGGFVAQQLVPPVLIVAIGGILAGRPWGSIGPIAIRWVGFATLVARVAFLFRGMAMVISNGG